VTTTTRTAARHRWPAATAIVVALASLIAPVGESQPVSAQEPADPERELVERYAPIVYLKAQEGPCDPDGEPYAPSAVDIVLAINFNRLETVTYNELPPSIVAIDPQLAKNLSLEDMAGYTGNIPILQDAASGSGNMNQLPDADGVVRRVPLLLRYDNELYPTLSVEMMRVYNFAEGYELVTTEYAGRDVVRAVRIGRGAGALRPWVKATNSSSFSSACPVESTSSASSIPARKDPVTPAT